MDDLLHVAALLELALEKRGFDGSATIMLAPDQFMSCQASLSRELATRQMDAYASEPNAFRIGSVTFKLDGKRPHAYREGLGEYLRQRTAVSAQQAQAAAMAPQVEAERQERLRNMNNIGGSPMGGSDAEQTQRALGIDSFTLLHGK